MSELKDCPFCGGEAYHDVQYEELYCTKCEVKVSGATSNVLIKEWNTRQDITRAKIEELIKEYRLRGDDITDDGQRMAMCICSDLRKLLNEE